MPRLTGTVIGGPYPAVAGQAGSETTANLGAAATVDLEQNVLNYPYVEVAHFADQVGRLEIFVRILSTGTFRLLDTFDTVASEAKLVSLRVGAERVRARWTNNGGGITTVLEFALRVRGN